MPTATRTQATPNPIPTTPPRSATRTHGFHSIKPGSTINLPENWHLTTEDPECLGFERDDGLASAALCAQLLSAGINNTSPALRRYAQLRQDLIADAYQQGALAFYELLTSEPLDVDDRYYERLHYSFQRTEDSCLEDRVMIIQFRETTENLYGVSLRVGICTSDGAPDESERSLILKSCRP